MFKHSQLESVKAWLSHPDHAGLPLHARIQRGIRQLIVDGAIVAGRPLPASRVLAVSLGVSRDTVEAAYTQLHAEGFIARRVGSGSVVAELGPFRPLRGGARHRTRAPVSALTLSRRGAALCGAGQVQPHAMPHPFTPGIPETRSFPLALWERLQRQALKDAGSSALLQSDPQGLHALRCAIADHVNLERGARARPEQVLVLTSSQQAMALCANMLLDAGERIFIEDPVYHGARRAFDAAGLACIAVPVDAAGLRTACIEAAPRGARAVFLTPSHHFPTGATLSLERRLALIEWAAREQAWIIEDDYDSEFHYAGRPTACVQGLDRHGRTLYIGTFTKALFPGLRIGYMVLPAGLVEPMTAARTLQDGHTASIAQLTLARFIQGGHFGAYVRAMRAVYAERLVVLVDLVRTHLHAYVEPVVPVGGLQMSCLLTCGLEEGRVVAAARAQGIALQGLSPLHAGATLRPGFLLGFAAYTAAEMQAATLALAAVLQRLHRGRST